MGTESQAATLFEITRQIRHAVDTDRSRIAPLADAAARLYGELDRPFQVSLVADLVVGVPGPAKAIVIDRIANGSRLDPRGQDGALGFLQGFETRIKGGPPDANVYRRDVSPFMWQRWMDGWRAGA